MPHLEIFKHEIEIVVLHERPGAESLFMSLW